MTAEHLSQIQLLGYGARTLNSEELLAVDRHLASCDECHARLAEIVSDRSYDLLTKEEPFHLDYDQHVAPYVDGTADEIDREIIESHIALCSQCADDIRDIQEFRQQPSRAAEVSRWPGWMGQWQWLQPLNPRFAVALVIVLFVLGVTAAVWLWAKNRSPLPVQQAGHVTPSPPDNLEGYIGPSPAASPDVHAGVIPPETLGKINAERDPSLIALLDGEQHLVTFKNGQSTGLESLPPELRTTVENVLAARRFGRSPALTDGLTESNGKLRGGSEEHETIEQLAPAGVVIQNAQPTFHWSALEGASEYVVTVMDSQLRLIESSGPVTGHEWSISKPLQRGETYSWQIRTVINGKTVISPRPPAPETRFRILDQKAVTAIETAKRTQSKSHLALAVLYWKHGLLEAAEREAELLARANPDSPVVDDLLRSLRSLKRR